MPMGNGIHPPDDRLALLGRLFEISRVAPWIERLALRYSISANTQYAIHLCLEEAITNAILHGYGGESDRPVTLEFYIHSDGYYLVTVEDEARRYNPLAAPQLSALSPQRAVRVGGQGIRFLREFSDTIEYEAIPNGNRLRIGFSSPESEIKRVAPTKNET